MIASLPLFFLFRFAAYNIGALAVTNIEGKVIGVGKCKNDDKQTLGIQNMFQLILPTLSSAVSERDYVCKLALLGRSSKTTPISEVSGC